MLRAATLAHQRASGAQKIMAKQMLVDAGKEDTGLQAHTIAIQQELNEGILGSMDYWDNDEEHERIEQLDKLSAATQDINFLYQAQLKRALTQFTATQLSQNLTFCSYSASEGIHDCPIDSAKDKKEFIIVLHNPSMYNQSMVRVKVDSKDFKASFWSKVSQMYEYVDSDILEQVHLVHNHGTVEGSHKEKDFEMFIPILEEIQAGEIAFVKVERQNGDRGYSNPRYKNLASETSLEVAGITQHDEVMFKFKND